LSPQNRRIKFACAIGHKVIGGKAAAQEGARLEPESNYDLTQLSWAAVKGDKALVKLLLDKGAKLESIDKEFGRTPMLWAAIEGQEGVVKLLLEKGAALESKDNNHGRTPLSYVAEEGHKAVVKLLLERGTKLETKDRDYD
jgi:ankyrin repeat protein